MKGWAIRFFNFLGDISQTKGEREKAVHHYNVAIGIASRFDWPDEPFWIHYSLAILFGDGDEFDDAHSHIRQAKQRALSDKYFLGRAMEVQAQIWYRQGRLEDEVSEALCAIEIYRNSGLRRIWRIAEVSSRISRNLRLVNLILVVSIRKPQLFPTPVNLPPPARATLSNASANTYQDIGYASGRVSHP